MKDHRHIQLNRGCLRVQLAAYNWTDTIDGGIGNDILYGGKGADTFYFDLSDSGDKIADFNPLEGDVIKVDGAEGAINSEFLRTGEKLEITFNFAHKVEIFSVDIFLDTDASASSWDDFL